MAVTLVVVGHAGLAFSGGYVGVDVFFVISGFLISQLLFREASRTGRLSLLGFYARRARRILPAASVVVVATVVASSLWVSKVQAVEVDHDAWWAALFAANIRFAHQEVDYFAQGEATSPLQHYWSLSVEEQFYVVWPILLLACLVLFRRRRPGLPRRVIACGLGLATAGSLAWSIWATQHSPQTAYFSTWARAWELGVGALVALSASALVRRWSRRARELVSLAGLALVGYAAVAFDAHTAMPGTAAIVPVAGAALLLVAGASPTTAPTYTSRALSIRPLRRIGDWSYSIYLWHWPLLLIPQLHAGRELSLTTNLGLAALSVVFAAFTYRWVEVPFRFGFRRGQLLPPWSSVLLYPAALLCVGLVALGSSRYVQWSVERGDNPPVTLTNFGVSDEAAFDLPTDRRLALVKASVIAARHHMAVPSQLTPNLLDLRDDVPGVGDCEYWTGTHQLCPEGDPGGSRTMVVLGDSHARMWIPAIDHIAQGSNYRVYYLVLPRCSPGRFLLGDAETGTPLTSCADFNAWAMSEIAELRPDTVLVTAAPVGRHGGVWVDGENFGQPEGCRDCHTGRFPRLVPRSIHLRRSVDPDRRHTGPNR